jgi:transposase
MDFRPEIQVETFKFQDDCWVVSASGAGTPLCPACGKTSSSRHSWHNRQLQDLPAQGAPVVLKLRLGRWRCHNNQCIRKTFVERLPSIVAPFARRTSRVAELVRLFCHAAGGRVSERLLARLAMWVSDNTILRQLKNYARNVGDAQPIRIVGIDDWCWRRGDSYGTIIVDLERRKVVDVLPKRSVEETATWLKRHPRLRSSAGTGAGCMLKGRGTGHLRQSRSLTDFISCRIYARPSNSK